MVFLLFFFFFIIIESKIARIAVFLAIDNALRATFCTDLFMVYRRIQRLCFLQAFAADRCFKIVAGQEASATLAASQAIHLAFWLPAVE